MTREDLAFYLLTLLAPLIALGFGLWQVYLGYVQFGPAAMVAWGQPWFVTAGWATIPLIFLTARAVLFAQREVQIIDQGLILYGMFFGTGRKTIAWKHLHGISVEDTRYHLLTLTLRIRRKVYLFLTTGQPIALDDRFQDLTGLADTIKSHLYPHLLPELRTQWKANQWLYFGEIQINQTAMKIGKQSLQWQQVKSLRVHNGFLIIEVEGAKSVQIPAAKIPNLELLLQLVEELYTGQ